MAALFTLIFGILEFTLFTFTLSYSFTELTTGNTGFLPCLALIAFLLWIGSKVSNITKD